MKLAYKGFKAGQKVVLNETCINEYGLIDRGTVCTIKGFPPKVRKLPCTSCHTAKCQSNDYFVLLTHSINESLVRVELCCIIKQ